MNKYTFKGDNGIWNARKARYTESFETIKAKTIIVECDNGELNLVSVLGQGEAAEANSHLIAAAPDLLQALIKIEKWNVQHAIDQYGDATKADTWSCVVEARKAIHKALNL